MTSAAAALAVSLSSCGLAAEITLNQYEAIIFAYTAVNIKPAERDGGTGRCARVCEADSEAEAEHFSIQKE